MFYIKGGLGGGVISDCGERVLKIEIIDDGDGMDDKGLKSFFNLGNLMRRETKDETGVR